MFFPGHLLLAAVRAVGGGTFGCARVEGPVVPEGYLDLDVLEVGKLAVSVSMCYP